MRSAWIGLCVLGAAALAGVTPGEAQFWDGKGTWCIAPPPGGGIWHCHYYSRAQCEQTSRSGCTPSPAAEWDRREGKTKAKPRPGQR
jgi:hypothetical protein